MIFQDYRRVTFNEDEGDHLVHTTEWSKTYVIVEMTAVDSNASGESVTIIADDHGDVTIRQILMQVIAPGFGDVAPRDSRIRCYPGIFPSGVDIRLIAVNENNVEGILHLFRLPSSLT
jgi:hypothetical protein